MNNQNSKKDNSPTINFSSIGGKLPPVEEKLIEEGIIFSEF
jgi:hypothetical protein